MYKFIIRIPYEFQLDATEVEIFRQGNALIIRPKQTTLAKAFQWVTEMSEDFMIDGREDAVAQDRKFDV